MKNQRITQQNFFYKTDCNRYGAPNWTRQNEYPVKANLQKVTDPVQARNN